MSNHFADRLAAAVRAKGTPLVVGLDPVYDRLPAALKTQKATTLANQLNAIVSFCQEIIDIVAPLAAAVKINSAYFERYYWQGVEAYFQLVRFAADSGLVVIGDVKRGDIGHTAACYAEGHLATPSFEDTSDLVLPDAITVNGFAGAEGIEPFAQAAARHQKGIFVWVRASNKSAAAIQDAPDKDGVKMYDRLAGVVGQIAQMPNLIGQSGYSAVGMVVGGTSPAETTHLRAQFPYCWFLVPGYGSQGASAADCMRFADANGLGVLVNASRSIIYAFGDTKYHQHFGDKWQKCVQQATIDAKLELAKAARG